MSIAITCLCFDERYQAIHGRNDKQVIIFEGHGYDKRINFTMKVYSQKQMEVKEINQAVAWDVDQTLKMLVNFQLIH